MMKKITNLIVLLTLVLTLSCEDSINYQSEFKEESILYCIINADEESHYAMLKKSYPDENTLDDNYIEDAEITLSSDDKLVSLMKNEGDGVVLPKQYYSTNNFKPSFGSTVTINAKLDDDTDLSSTIQLPDFSLFFFDRHLLEIPLTSYSESYILRWTLKNPVADYTFLTALFIEYSVLENNVEQLKKIEIPIEEVYQNGVYFPIYPQVTENTYQRLSQQNINSVLTKISEGDTNKSSYKILGGYLDLYIIEENLATYYSSSEAFRNAFSVKVYENDISNIKGGKGVFGAYIKKTLPLEISSSYIRSFGYSTN